MNKYLIAIGLALIVLGVVLVSNASAGVICEGTATAQDIVSDVYYANDYAMYAGNSYAVTTTAHIKYDLSKDPLEMSFTAYNVRVTKDTDSIWYYDEAYPTKEVIPDTVSDAGCTLTTAFSEVVGTVRFTFVKRGSCGGSADFLDGVVDMDVDITITDSSYLTGGGITDLRANIPGAGFIDDFYANIYTSPSTADALGDDMEANEGFWVGFHASSERFPGYHQSYGSCSAVNRYALYSYFNFKNYYTVTQNPTNITVDVEREGSIYEGYSVKSKLRSYDDFGFLLTESGWSTTDETYVLANVSQSIYIVPDFGDAFTEVFICTYEGEDTTKIYGTVYNAENGSTITAAKVDIDIHHDTYSDAGGFYIIRTDPGTHILTVTKDGYWDWQETIYFDYTGDYEIDIGLIPKQPTHTGHGILGTVRTFPYYLPVENQLVSIENATWSNTTTTNNVGYYLFDNLEVDDYWINVTKTGYRDNNGTVTVSATGDEIVTIDNCDATTDWDSDNTLTLNTTDKQEGTGSLQANGSSTMDFNKSASSAIDASNVTKENGYMTFWYKVNDTTRITDYLVFTVGSNGDNSTHKISWSVYKSNFVSGTWKEIWLKFSDGTETGTLNMSNINWVEVKAAKSDSVLSKIDDIRFYDFSYEIHDVDLDPILSLGVIAKTTNEEVVASFGAILDGDSLNTTSGEELVFTNLSYGMKELTVTSEGYFPYQRSVYLDSNTNITAYMQEGAEGGAGVYYPPPHLVEFRVVDIWGVPLSNIAVTATGYETTVINLTWWQTLFGFSSEIEVYNSTATGTTDSAGHISFFMVETIKYKMWFTNASQNVSAYREIYPKDERYTVTVGEIPEQKLAYWITTEQNNSANSGNISLHYLDYNSPIKTNWVNFSVYFLENDTLAYTHNFTSINETNENTSIDLNASYSYKVKCIANHDDFGEFIWYVMVVYILPEKPKLPVVQTLKDSLSDWQIQLFSLFVIILFSLIFGGGSQGVAGMVVSFMAIGFHLFGLMPLVPTAAGVVIYPLIAVMSIINLLGERKEEPA